MRLISQDGQYEVPYESVIVKITTQEGRLSRILVEAFSASNTRICALGKYYEEETLERIMSELHEQYESGSKYFVFPRETSAARFTPGLGRRADKK